MRLLLGLLLAVLLGMCLYLGIRWTEAERRAAGAAHAAGEIETRLDGLRDSIARAAPPPGGTGEPEFRSLLSDGDLEQLRALGLADPVHQLLEDLSRHPELIPFEGTLGGAMGFHPPSCAVISPEWVYAYFEDGHVAGRALLEYQVRPGGEIRWKRLSAKLD